MPSENKAERYVLDTSVIVDGRITEGIRNNRFPNAVFIVPNAVLALLEAQAVRGQETGYTGLNELKQLQQLAWEGKIRLAETGELHAMVRAVAEEENAILLTSSRSQALVSEAQGLPMQFLGAAAGAREL
jgi:ATPase